MGSGIFKQAVTSAKLHGGTEGLTNTNAFAGSGGEGALGRWIGDLPCITHESWWNLPLDLEVQVGLGVPPVAYTSWEWCKTLSHPGNSGTFFSSAGFDVWVCLWDVSGAGGLGTTLFFFLGEDYTQKTSSSIKEGYHPISLLNSQTLSAKRHGLPLASRLFCSA